MAREAIFIGYRRDDTADVAGRIYDAMAQRFGKARIFKDVDKIGPGVDFGDYIKSVLPRCRVALVLIGPGWLLSKDDSGNRRLDDPHDWVRVEIETALATSGVLVVPVLVNGARMPTREEVPESLTPLLRRNAAIIRRDPDFHDDVGRLATALRSSINSGTLDLSKVGGRNGASADASRQSAPASRMGLLIGAVIVALALTGALMWRPWRASEVVDQRSTVSGSSAVTSASNGNAADSAIEPDFGVLIPTQYPELVARGRQVAAQCASCHTFNAGGPNLVGPNLAQAFGSTPGAQPGFEYSASMREHGGVWGFSELNDFLRAPNAVVPGTRMTFAGLRNVQDRVAMIAYLRSISPNSQSVPIPAPLPQAAHAPSG